MPTPSDILKLCDADIKYRREISDYKKYKPSERDDRGMTTYQRLLINGEEIH